MPLGALRQASELLADPSRIPAASVAAYDTVRATVVQLSDTERARSPLWAERSLRRRLDVLRAPIDATKAAAKALGGTLNTAFVTVAATAAGRYHAELGRAGRAPAGVDGDQHPHPGLGGQRLHAGPPAGAHRRHARWPSASPLIAEAAGTARAGSATANLDTLAAVAATLPLSLVTRIARQQTQTVDFATSNVRAAPFAVYIAGAKVLENYPIGPLGGVAFNLTLMSYDGSLDIGPAHRTRPRSPNRTCCAA